MTGRPFRDVTVAPAHVPFGVHVVTVVHDWVDDHGEAHRVSSRATAFVEESGRMTIVGELPPGYPPRADGQ